MGSVSLVSVAIGEKRVAVAASAVVEIVRAVATVGLPKSPEIVEGVINVRGRLVPVLDVRRRFGLPPRPLTPEQHFVIAHAGPREVALRVDRALELVEVDDVTIQAVEHVVPGTEYIAGIAALPDGLIVIHDLERFLSLDEAVGVDTAMGEAGRRNPAVAP